MVKGVALENDFEIWLSGSKLETSEKARWYIIDIDEFIISYNGFLYTIFVEVHCEVYVWNHRWWTCVQYSVVLYLDPCEWLDRAFECDMLDVYWNLRVDPSCIEEAIICKGDVTVLLGVHQSCISTNVYSDECVIIPDLIVCDPRLLIQGALTHWLVDGYSIDLWYVDNWIRNIEVRSFLCHNQLLPQFECTAIGCNPFKGTEVRKE